MSSSANKSELRLDWCTHEAMVAGLRVWYYRDVVPIGKLVRVGVWEDGAFSGVVVFGCGSSDALGKRFGLTSLQVCEMSRIALRPDHKCAVSKVINLAVAKFLRVRCPGIRLVLTFSDPEAGHHGGVYQGAGWIYIGKSAEDRRYLINGEWHHSRGVRACGTVSKPGGGRGPCPKPSDATRVEKIPGKHRYALPLDDEMRALVMREGQPYPKRETSPTEVPAPPR
jgi:hypothetical protein